MRDIAKSIISFPWAMSLLSVQQFANALTPQESSQSPDKVAFTFSSVTYATKEQFNDVIKAAFEVGDTLQKGIVDLMFGALTLRSLNPTSVLQMTCNIIQENAGPLMRALASAGSAPESSGGGFLSSLSAAAQSALPSVAQVSALFVPAADRGVALQEFQNTLKAVELVPEVSAELHLPPPGTYLPLTELVARAYSLAPFPALWAVEGLGKYYGDTFWERNEVPRNALTDEKVRDLPDKSLTMLHAGIGLSVATRLMQTINPHTPVSEIRRVLQQIIALIEDNSRAGYAGCALESLGLVTRTFYPEMVPIVDQQLLEVAQDVVGYFWHGVGRAIYFNPGLLLPGCGAPWRAIELCWQEARHELGLLNAIAGVTWAVTMVNLRNPEIVERLLSHHGDQLSEGRAFPNGMSSSLIMRYDTTPDEPSITAFCQHQPDPTDPRLVELWNDQVKRPCEDALQKYYPALKKQNRLEEVFHYQSLGELVGRPKPEPRERPWRFSQQREPG